MKKALLSLALIMAGALALRAQDVDSRGSGYGVSFEQMRRMANKGSTNLGFSIQSLTRVGPTLGYEIGRAELGASLSRSRTFVLHPRPLAGMIYLGLDANWVDLTYARYGSQIMGIDISALTDRLDMHKADISILGVGPSINVFPVGKLGLHAYARYNPTFATLFRTGDDFCMSGGYASVLTAGTAVSWGVVSVGVETRFGEGNYKKLLGEGVDVGKYQTTGMRFYVGLRY